MAAFQQKANDLHSYIQEIESREKNYRKFKVFAAFLTFIFTLSIIAYVWVDSSNLKALRSLLPTNQHNLQFETISLDQLDLRTAENQLHSPNQGLIITTPESETGDTIQSIDQLKAFAESQGLAYPNVPANPVEEAGEKLPFTRVDKMPYFPGGKIALARYLQAQLSYPTEAREKQVEGSVQVRFVIQPDGSVSDVKVVEGIGYGCDREAIRLVSAMPNWIPGEQAGESVAVYKALAIKFQLL